jgi:hypothetical protein
MEKVSFVCTTYRRFTCVQRIVNQFYAQSYENKELIIYNTDEEYPYELGFTDSRIVVVNNGKNMLTGEPYKNRGEICRDAIRFASGYYFMLADDDDIYLPWHIKQAVDGIFINQKDAWKPEMSFFASQSELSMAMNTMEASVIVKMNRIRDIGFRSDLTGYEGLSWYSQLRDEGNLDEHNKNYVPSYCFNWSDPQDIAGHKQSGNINDPNNFEQHKLATQDYVKGPLIHGLVGDIYNKYYDYLIEHESDFNPSFYRNYATPYLKRYTGQYL